MNPVTTSSDKSKTSTFKSDLLASIVVFLVALPLCMGIAIASGAPVAAGLITGIVGGLVVGSIAGCPLQVSGPAAGLTVIVYDIIQHHGLEMLGLGVLLAGIMQMIAGVMRLGQWFRAVSPAVIQGMLAGIGFLILASQFHVMIDDKPSGSGAQELGHDPGCGLEGRQDTTALATRGAAKFIPRCSAASASFTVSRSASKNSLPSTCRVYGSESPLEIPGGVSTVVKSLATARTNGSSITSPSWKRQLIEFEQKAPDNPKADNIIRTAQEALASGRTAIAATSRAKTCRRPSQPKTKFVRVA